MECERQTDAGRACVARAAGKPQLIALAPPFGEWGLALNTWEEKSVLDTKDPLRRALEPNNLFVRCSAYHTGMIQGIKFVDEIWDYLPTQPLEEATVERALFHGEELRIITVETRTAITTIVLKE